MRERENKKKIVIKVYLSCEAHDTIPWAGQLMMKIVNPMLCWYGNEDAGTSCTILFSFSFPEATTRTKDANKFGHRSEREDQ